MRRHWKWISALIVIAVLGVVWRVREQRPSPPAPEPIAAVQVPAPLPLSFASVSGAPRKPAAKGDHSHEIEICGAGEVKLDRDDPAAAGKYLDSLTRNSRLHWLAALRDSDDLRARAAGLYLEGIFDRDSTRKDPDAAREEMVQLAEGSHDPAVFALAYIKCLKGVEDLSAEGACPQLSVDDWTRADGDNAVPWLQLAAKARRENNAAAEAAAMAQAARAHRYETYNWSLLSFALTATPGEMTAADQWFLTTEIIGVQAAMPVAYLPLLQYCSHDALKVAAVYQQCNALAELMVNKATTLFDLSVSKALGTRVGWPVSRTDKLTQELKASMQAMNRMMPFDSPKPYSCDSVARGNAFMTEWRALGEREQARLAIERSGETVAELSRQYDEKLAALAQEAQGSPQAHQAQP